MELYLHHGRKTPCESLNDWGPNGPRLKGVAGIHQTYGTAAHVFFETNEARDEALALTGWEVWDANALEMRWEDDLIVVTGRDGVTWYFGDWGLM